MDLIPGQWWQRMLASFFGAGAVWLFVTRDAHRLPAAIPWIPAALFVLFGLLAVPPLYRRWMRFAAWSSVWMTRAIFSLIYLLVVPVVRVLHALSSRSRQEPGTSLWIARGAHARSIEDMERMG